MPHSKPQSSGVTHLTGSATRPWKLRLISPLASASSVCSTHFTFADQAQQHSCCVLDWESLGHVLLGRCEERGAAGEETFLSEYPFRAVASGIALCLIYQIGIITGLHQQTILLHGMQVVHQLQIFLPVRAAHRCGIGNSDSLLGLSNARIENTVGLRLGFLGLFDLLKRRSP